MLLLGDAVGFNQDADGTTCLWVVLLCEPVSTFILKVGFTNNQQIPMNRVQCAAICVIADAPFC